MRLGAVIFLQGYVVLKNRTTEWDAFSRSVWVMGAQEFDLHLRQRWWSTWYGFDCNSICIKRFVGCVHMNPTSHSFSPKCKDLGISTADGRGPVLRSDRKIAGTFYSSWRLFFLLICRHSPGKNHIKTEANQTAIRDTDRIPAADHIL